MATQITPPVLAMKSGTQILAVSLGSVDTLIQHPAYMTHANIPRDVRMKTGITDDLVRITVGIEEPEDIIADLDQALGSRS